MKYKIDITGIHCSGCVNLIKMSLEDVGLENVKVEESSNTAVFKSDKQLEDITTLIDSVFLELKEYNYSNLHVIE